MSKPLQAKDALPLAARMSSKTGRVAPPVDAQGQPTAWPAIPRWVPSIRGAIEVVRPARVIDVTEDDDGSRLQEDVDGRYNGVTRRIMLSATLKRPKAWQVLEAMRYRSRIQDTGMQNILEPREIDALSEALARQHIRSFRREGPMARLPLHAPPHLYPPIPSLVYEWGEWVRVDRPTTAPPNRDDLLDQLGGVNFSTHHMFVLRNLPRPTAWLVLWHERYEARLDESAMGKLLDYDIKEAVCDAMAAARVAEAQMAHTWVEHPETHPLAWPEAPPSRAAATKAARLRKKGGKG